MREALPASVCTARKPQVTTAAIRYCPEVLVLYRMREQARRGHEHGVFEVPFWEVLDEPTPRDTLAFDILPEGWKPVK